MDIDIKPGSFPNSVNLGSPGVVPVAILTTATFNAADVDPSTVVLEDAPSLRWAFEDVDGDGDIDMILHFNKREVTVEPGQIEACLHGFTLGGVEFQGCDSIRIVPPGADIDGDIFDDDIESSIGTDPLDECSSGGDNDAWPPDANSDGSVNLLDVVNFKAPFGKSLGDDGYERRFDLEFDGSINLLDLLPVRSSWSQLCTDDGPDTDGDTIVDGNDDDDDNDGFADDIELYLDTDHRSACAADSSHQAWPADFDNDRVTNLLDVLRVKLAFSTNLGDPAFDKRSDLNADLGVDLIDVLAIKPHFGDRCD